MASNAKRRRAGSAGPIGGAALAAGLVAGLVFCVSTGWNGASFSVGLPRQSTGHSRCAQLVARRADKLGVDPDEPKNAEDIEVWDQCSQELALDVRELLISDGNLFFVGPDVESYEDDIRAVAEKLNYTAEGWPYDNFLKACECTTKIERVYWVPPLYSIQRWTWKVMYHGLIIFIDEEGWEYRDYIERHNVRNRKFPKKKSIFGPETSSNFVALESNIDAPPGDPIDMWFEADVHVNLKAHPEMSVQDCIMASIIDAIMKSPPKWREWFKAAKVRGTIPSDYQTPLQVRREFNSFGISPRLNKLLNA